MRAAGPSHGRGARRSRAPTGPTDPTACRAHSAPPPTRRLHGGSRRRRSAARASSRSSRAPCASGSTTCTRSRPRRAPRSASRSRASPTSPRPSSSCTWGWTSSPSAAPSTTSSMRTTVARRRGQPARSYVLLPRRTHARTGAPTRDRAHAAADLPARPARACVLLPPQARRASTRPRARAPLSSSRWSSWCARAPSWCRRSACSPTRAGAGASARSRCARRALALHLLSAHACTPLRTHAHLTHHQVRETIFLVFAGLPSPSPAFPRLL